MKIKDYKLFLESNEDIDSICKEYNIRNYTINNDGTIDVDGNVDLRYKRLVILPLKFGKVTGYFNCRSNYLSTLEGSPDWVGGLFSCADNQLTTLEGGPNVVLGSYWCNDNIIINFKGFPEDFEHNIYIKDNPVSKLLIDIPRNKENKFIYWCNEFDAITDEGKVIPERMEEVYNKLGLEYED